jgi:NAD(P)H-nitrite reductase large subunit
MLDFEAAGFLQQKLEETGIDIILGADAMEIIGEEGRIMAVKLDSGKAFACSLVVVGKGVAPNIDLVKETEVKINEGILSNEFLQTSVPNIYTAGDVCESLDLAFGRPSLNALWPVAVEQGKIAGANIAGAKVKYAGSLAMNSLDFASLPVISVGRHKIKEEEKAMFEELKRVDKKAGLYRKLILKDNILLGAILVGDIKNAGVFLRLIRERIDICGFKDKLLLDNFGYPDILDFVKEEEKVYV